MGTELDVSHFWVSRKVSLFLCQKGNSCSIHQLYTCSHFSYACRKTFENEQKNFLKYFNGLYSWHGMYIVLMIQNVRQERQKTRMKRIFATRRVVRKFLCNMQQRNRWMTRWRQCKNLSFDNYAKSVSFTYVKERRLFLREYKNIHEERPSCL